MEDQIQAGLLLAHLRHVVVVVVQHQGVLRNRDGELCGFRDNGQHAVCRHAGDVAHLKAFC